MLVFINSYRGDSLFWTIRLILLLGEVFFLVGVVGADIELLNVKRKALTICRRDHVGFAVRLT